jgi:hypothetical protein
MRQEWDFNIRRGVHYEDGKDCPGKYSCDGLVPVQTVIFEVKPTKIVKPSTAPWRVLLVMLDVIVE